MDSLSLGKALQLSVRVSQTWRSWQKTQTCLEIDQWYWCNSKLQSGGHSLVQYTAAVSNTCSKDSPLILPARQTDREIDDCVGKWQPREKLTCKRRRVRERWREGHISGCEQRRCVWCVLVTAQQLHHMSEGKGGSLSSSLLLSKQPHLAPWCCCHGVEVFLTGLHCSHRQREKTMGFFNLNWGRMRLFPSSAFPPPPPTPLPFDHLLHSHFLSVAKNSLPQTPWQLVILKLGCR